MQKLNTVILDSDLNVTSQDTSTIEAFSTYQNYLRITVPYDTTWIPYAIFKPTNAGNTVGIAAEYLLMSYKEQTTIDGSTYYTYEIDFPPAVLSNALANRIDVTNAFIAQIDGLLGVKRYDEDEEGYNDTTYIAAQLLIDYPNAEEDDYVRVINTETDWQFNGTAWVDQDDIILTDLEEHRSNTYTYALRRGTSTSRPTHAPNNTEAILNELAKKANATDVEDDHYTKTESEARYVNVNGDTMSGDLSMGTNKITDLSAPTLNNDATRKAYVDSADDGLQSQITSNADDIVILDERLDDYDTANVLKSVTFNTSTYVLTFTSYDDTTQTFDFPLESAIVDIEYDEENKDLIFTLQNGTETIVPLDDIISGLATETYVANYVATALADYYTKTEVYTQTETDNLLTLYIPKNFSVFTELLATGANSNDIITVRDTSTNETKKMTLAELENYLFSNVGEFNSGVDYGPNGLGANFSYNQKIYQLFGTNGLYGLSVRDIQDNMFAIVQFPDTSSDTTSSTQISFDDGTTYRYLKLNGADIAPSDLSETKLMIYRDGTVLKVYKENAPEQTIPYNAQYGSYDEGKNSLGVGIFGKNLVNTANYKGMTIASEQLVSNGDFSDGTTGWSGSNSILSESNNILSITGNGTAVNPRASQNLPFSTKKYYIKAKVMVTNSLCTKIQFYGGGNSQFYKVDDIDNPTVNEWYITSGVLDMTSGAASGIFITHNYVDSATANGKVMEVDYVYAYNISNMQTQYSPLYDDTFSNLTDEQIKAQMDAWIEDGILPDDGILTTGQQRTYNEDDYDDGFNAFIQSQGYEEGDTIQGVYGRDTATGYDDNYWHINETLYRIGTVYDDLTTQRIGRDYNDVFQSSTTWIADSELTNTIKGFEEFTDLLDFKFAVNDASISNIYLKIGDTIYPSKSKNDLNNFDSIGIALDSAVKRVFVRFNKTTIGGNTANDIEAYLQANDVEFIYELATEVPRNVDVIGQHMVVKGGTYEQSTLGGEFDLVLPIDIFAQQKINVDTDIKQGNELKDHEGRLNVLESCRSGVFAYLSASADTTCTVADTWYAISGTFTNDISNGFGVATVNTPGIKYTQATTKTFEIDYHATLSGDSNGITVELGVKKNGTIVDGSIMGNFLKNLDEVQVMSGTVFVELEQDDEIQLVVNADGAGDVITFDYYTTTIREF